MYQLHRSSTYQRYVSTQLLNELLFQRDRVLLTYKQRQLSKLLSLKKSVQTWSSSIGDLYIADSHYTHVIHSGSTKTDSNDIGSVRYSVYVGIGVMFTLSVTSTFDSSRTLCFVCQMLPNCFFLNNVLLDMGTLFLF